MDLLERGERALILPALGALDAARTWSLKRGARFLRPFVRSRDRRVAALALVACLSALSGSVLAPGYVLLLGPLFLGMPHLFFEARYLFFQRGGSGRRALVLILCTQTVAVLAGAGIYTFALACTAALVATGAARQWKGRLLLLLAAIAQTAAVVGPTWSRFVLLHAHNCVPVLVWFLWRRRPAVFSGAVLLVALGGAVAILAGCFDAVPIRTPLRDDVFSLTRLTDAVAGGFGGEWRPRLLLFFCYTQAVHYAVWLRLIPEEARPRETPRSFRASFRAYALDSGSNVARMTVLASLAIPVLALALGAVRVRSLYVTASEFHATVEVVLLAVLAGTTRPRASPTATHHPIRAR